MEANAAADHLMRIVGGEAVACVGETTLERFRSGLAFVVGDRGRAPVRQMSEAQATAG